MKNIEIENKIDELKKKISEKKQKWQTIFWKGKFINKKKWIRKTII